MTDRRLISLPFLSPRGRDGTWTAVNGAYVVDKDPRRGLPYRVVCEAPGGRSGTLCESLAGALDAVIAHHQTGGWQ